MQQVGIKALIQSRSSFSPLFLHLDQSLPLVHCHSDWKSLAIPTFTARQAMCKSVILSGQAIFHKLFLYIILMIATPPPFLFTDVSIVYVILKVSCSFYMLAKNECNSNFCSELKKKHAPKGPSSAFIQVIVCGGRHRVFGPFSLILKQNSKTSLLPLCLPRTK